MSRLVPVRLGSGGLRADPAAEPELRDRLEHVLRHYGVRYRREPDGFLTWTSPLGRRYTVDHHGTTAHD